MEDLCEQALSPGWDHWLLTLHSLRCGIDPPLLASKLSSVLDYLIRAHLLAHLLGAPRGLHDGLLDDRLCGRICGRLCRRLILADWGVSAQLMRLGFDRVVELEDARRWKPVFAA